MSVSAQVMPEAKHNIGTSKSGAILLRIGRTVGENGDDASEYLLFVCVNLRCGKFQTVE